MFGKLRIILLSGLLIVAFLGVKVRADAPTIDVLSVKGTINPVLADYIRRGIQHAEDTGAIACVIELDTPGGLDTSMRDIVKEIVDAQVPVIVYVSPAGARAASAGVFITVAAHVGAMAPNTAIGAAHPVSVGGGEISSTMEEKVVNDAAAYIRSIAQAHGRNMEWAEKAVRESVSATEQEALKLNVIDLIATDLNDLIAKLDGRQVKMLDGTMVTLQTRYAVAEKVGMTVSEEFLHTIADPNIAYLLLALATIGIIAEIYSPGLIFPGIVGGISLLLGLYAMGVLPVNYAGLLLIILAVGLFIAELFTPSFGILTVGGIVSLVLGSMVLFKGGPLFQVSPWLIAAITVVIAGFFTFVVSRVVKAHRRRASTGREELIGKTAVVRIAVAPEGMVFFNGELWAAVADSGQFGPGEEVVITSVEGLKLHVAGKIEREAK